jgi:hypothetical protein
MKAILKMLVVPAVLGMTLLFGQPQSAKAREITSGPGITKTSAYTTWVSGPFYFYSSASARASYLNSIGYYTRITLHTDGFWYVIYW